MEFDTHKERCARHVSGSGNLKSEFAGRWENEQTVKCGENPKKSYTNRRERAIIYELNYAYPAKRRKGGVHVKRMIRTALLVLSLCLLVLTASGCGGIGFTFAPQDLYSLPKLPPKYDAPSALLTEITDSGAEYAAPASGTNIQAVQMVDLNGDGQGRRWPSSAMQRTSSR